MGILRTLKLMTAAAFCVVLNACIPSTDTIADSVSRSADKVILVGSFEITPKIPQYLQPSQRLAAPLEGALFGTAEDALGDRLVTGFLPYGTQVNKTIYSTPWAGTTHSVPLDDLFFIEVDRTAIEMQPGQFFLSSGGDAIKLPGGFVTATHPTAQIVYVGTIRYQRDDFYAITDVRVLDRFSQAAAEARARYGADVTVSRALWRPAG